MQSHKLRISLGQEMLGTKSADPDLVREFIASKRPEGVDEEEVEAVERRDLEEDLSRATTVFPRTKAQEPFIYDYQVVGFFKDACGALRRAPGTFSNGLTAYRKIIDGLVFVRPREIVARLPEGGTIGWCQRPLRAQTAQGERVCLARSESLPVGTTFDLEIVLVSAVVQNGKKKQDLLEIVEEWLDYGQLRGLGQWRNSGKGRFAYEWLKS